MSSAFRLSLLGLLAVAAAHAQPPGGGFPGGGFGGPPGGQERKILKEFDANKDGWLNADERKAAREKAKQGGGRRGGGMRFGPGSGGERGGPVIPGPKLTPGEVTSHPDKPLYEPSVLRTLFLQFENPDWEQELDDFHGTDVDVPCTLSVDGKTYQTVGVHFRGMSSYMGVPPGKKRSLNLSLDTADGKQRLYGYKTLNLLNAHEDPSFLSTVLYSHVARKHTPAPNANLVRVVINGESWGVYANVQQFDKVFLQENYKTTKGTRWKVRGNPGATSGLEYLGDSVEEYKRKYEIKSDDDPKAWAALVNLCKVLNTTPPEKLEAELSKVMDIDQLLWFLALDVGLVNNDGYWVRSSDYALYLDPKGKFHIVPHDMNEAFALAGGGPPMGGGRGGPGGPGGGRGGPGGPGGPGGGGFPGGPMMFPLPRPGEILPGPLADQLGLTDEQKKKLAELQKETDDKLAKLLTDDQNKRLKELRDRGPMMPGMGGPGGPMGGGGVELDPLVALTDARKPLRSKVLAVPALKAKYLANLKALADDLDWKALGPVVARYRDLIAKDVEADTRKLETTEAFRRSTADTAEAGGGRGMPLRAFADRRRAFLLNHPAVKGS